ncbi:YegP family protein [uncultured Maribacter sp.]|uniref:YegP family protein n=1 Tax=uncultured Maribacter sp. TaxID=431308 RepID=UPI0030D9C5E8|tara:strand:- start:11739 stop:12053 length:315 start_codon:yes stop_codon:yes gene_type:complete
MIKINKKKDGKFEFKLKSTNGKTLLKSISFSSKEELDKTLKDFKDLKDTRTIFFERKTNTEGKFLVELKNQNGQTLGSSGLYTSEAGMENGILNISNSLELNLQ